VPFLCPFQGIAQPPLSPFLFSSTAPLPCREKITKAPPHQNSPPQNNAQNLILGVSCHKLKALPMGLTPGRASFCAQSHITSVCYLNNFTFL